MSLTDWLQILAIVGVGVGAGIMSALLGVGGAVITTPAVRVLGATPIEAVGSTVPAILPGAISGSLRYAREGLVDWTAALGLGISGSLLAFIGAWVSDGIDGRVLMLLTAVLMLWSGISVMRGGRRAPQHMTHEVHQPGRISGLLDGSEEVETDIALAVPTDELTAAAANVRHPVSLLVILGAASGFVAGLLGVGGGIVMVPVLTGPLKVPMKSAVASSLVAVAIFSIPALITHAALGHIDWFYALPLMVGVVPGARIGAHLTIGTSEQRIRSLFGIMIVVLAIVYGASEAANLF